MKKFSMILFMAVSLMAFAGIATAEDEKKGKSDEAKLKSKGTVVTYAEGSNITVKSSEGEQLTFQITEKTRVKGPVTEGGKVRITYKKDGESMVATSISGQGDKKDKKKKKKKEKTSKPQSQAAK